MNTAYQACDGKTFEIREDAMHYEDRLFDSWVQALTSDGHPNPFNPSLAMLVRHFKDSHHLTCEGGEYHITPWDRLKESLREYWDDAMSRLKHTKRSD